MMEVNAANLALDIPFHSSELRELAERARQAVVAYDREVDRLEAEDELELEEPSPEFEALLGGAMETLSAVACLAGLQLDASFIPSLLRWPRWVPAAYEDSTLLPGESYFRSLTVLFAHASTEMQEEAARHRLPRVRRALAAALDPAQASQCALLERLLVDSQHGVGGKARERLGVDSVSWHRCVFAAPPEQLLEEAGCSAAERERVLAQLDELAPAFAHDPWRARQHDPKLVELLPRLPDVVAIPVLEYRLQQVGYPRPSAALAEELARRSGAGAVLSRVATTVVQNVRYGRLYSKEFDAWVEAVTPAARREACQCWVQVLRDASADQLRDSFDALVSLVCDHWSQDDDPTPLWDLWNAHWDRAAQYTSLESLPKLVAESGRFAELEAELLGHLQEHGAFPLAVKPAIDRLLESLPDERRQALVTAGLQSERPRYRLWALQQHATMLARRASPAECRQVARAWLDDAATRPVVLGDATLRRYVLPERRAALRRGELSREEADELLGDVDGVWGGVVLCDEWTRVDEAGPAKVRADLGAFLDLDGAPPTDAEWAAVRALRRADWDSAGRLLPCPLPPGAWHPDDLAVFDRELERFEAEPDADDALVRIIGLYGAVDNKPDPAVVPQLRRLHQLAMRDDVMDVYAQRLARLVERLGGRLEAADAEPRFEAATGEWMDEPDNEEEHP